MSADLSPPSPSPPTPPSPPLIDIGVNLSSGSYAQDRDEVVAQARHAGVSGMVLIASDLDDSQAVLQLCEHYPQCIATAGIHPHQASQFGEDTLATLRQLAASAHVRALGETGLDFNRNYSPRTAQLEAFEAQLQLGAEIGLPLYLHQRDAHSDFVALLRKYRPQLSKAVVHCFTGTAEELYDYLELDLYIGITGWICDERRGRHLQDVIQQIPADRLMLETDAPYLLPRTLLANEESSSGPFVIPSRPKSRRNEPRFLTAVLAEVARCLGKSQEQVARETSATAAEFFAWAIQEAI